VFALVSGVLAGDALAAVAVGFGAVWVSDFVLMPSEGSKPEPGKLLQLDPATRILDDVINVGKRPLAAATGGGSVWVANNGGKNDLGD
jgi:hypothetical protein